MVGDKESLETREVGPGAVPGNEDGAGGDVADVEGGDAGQRAQLRILHCHKKSLIQAFRLTALRTHFLAWGSC